MVSYDLTRARVRVAIGALFGVIIALAPHGSKRAWPPSTCNGTFLDAVIFEIALVGSLIFVEALHWLSWYVGDTGKAHWNVVVHTSARLFAPRYLVSSLLLAVFLLWIAIRYVGVFTPCEPAEHLTDRILCGQILEAYAILLLANFPWKSP
jgi:hypothetical protein